MSTPRTIWAIARADFLERVRRYSFLVTLLFAVYLGYAAATGRISLRLGQYRGLYTSAWIGATVSLVTTTFVSLVGFYIVKNAVERDRQTGVGQILASTPLSRSFYLLGKFTSNFAVLASMVGVLAFAAVGMQFLVAEDRVFHAWPLLSPFLLLSLPAMAVTAAVALSFETIQLLRRGFGNILWFFLWSLSIGLPGLIDVPQLDPLRPLDSVPEHGASGSGHHSRLQGGVLSYCRR
jgi:ABC-type transport system involved in multi-copper enzyme maturation permease subunit